MLIISNYPFVVNNHLHSNMEIQTELNLTARHLSHSSAPRARPQQPMSESLYLCVIPDRSQEHRRHSQCRVWPLWCLRNCVWSLLWVLIFLTSKAVQTFLKKNISVQCWYLPSSVVGEWTTLVCHNNQLANVSVRSVIPEVYIELVFSFPHSSDPKDGKMLLQGHQADYTALQFCHLRVLQILFSMSHLRSSLRDGFSLLDMGIQFPGQQRLSHNFPFQPHLFPMDRSFPCAFCPAPFLIV